METEKIKTLLLAVEKKSFSKAAEELSYTPSALSHIADSIEQDLGVKILDRTFNGIELNENGRLLLDNLCNVINAENELYRCAEKLKSPSPTIRIGTYSSIAQYLLPEIIKNFKDKYPYVKISIKVGNKINTWLHEDIADVIFSDNSPTNSCWTEMLVDPFFVVAHKEVLSNKQSVSKDELYDYTYIVHNEGILSRYFDQSKFKEVIKFESIDESSIISMVENNLGIAVLPKLMLPNKNKLIHFIPLDEKVSRTIGFAYKNNSNNSNISKFTKFINKNYPTRKV